MKNLFEVLAKAAGIAAVFCLVLAVAAVPDRKLMADEGDSIGDNSVGWFCYDTTPPSTVCAGNRCFWPYDKCRRACLAGQVEGRCQCDPE